MVLDSDLAELLSDACRADRPLDCVNDILGGIPKLITPLRALQQQRNHLVDSIDIQADLMVKLDLLHLAGIGPGKKLSISKYCGQRLTEIMRDESSHPAYSNDRIKN